jgi:hypothetical protein
MDANPGPSGNPPPGTRTGIRRFFAGLLGAAIILSPVTAVVGSLRGDDSEGPGSQVCQYWAEHHPEITQSSLGCR